MAGIQRQQRHSRHVTIRVRNTTGLIGLSRPKALNCLNQEMVDHMADALEAWRDDESVHRVVIFSTTDKAFCAGGDVRAARDAQLEGKFRRADRFFSEEYNLNRELSRFPKPVVACIDGYAMGGGLGISMHGSHRVITEKAVAAMPEALIGFTPDVGSTWKLQRLNSPVCPPSRAMANFLCLTGWRMNPADMLYTGLATDMVASADMGVFMDTVVAESLDEALEDHSVPEVPTDSPIRRFIDPIMEVFDHNTFAEIEQALSRCSNREFKTQVMRSFAPANPASLVATVELVTANSKVSSLQEALENEFAVGSALRRDDNFLEGVRAVLVDKDRKPTFTPSRTEDVDVSFFRELLS